MTDKNSGDEKESKPIIIRNTSDLQRMKLEKLMKNPDKPIIIPERPKERGVPVVPDFVRNVMGSSAGAGSGEFHVYRHLRRKEYARQKFMKEKGERERLDNDYHDKLEENKKKADAKTAKKRQKRLKRKQNLKNKNKKTKTNNESQSSSSSSSEGSSDADEEDNNDSTQSSESGQKKEADAKEPLEIKHIEQVTADNKEESEYEEIKNGKEAVASNQEKNEAEKIKKAEAVLAGNKEENEAEEIKNVEDFEKNESEEKSSDG